MAKVMHMRWRGVTPEQYDTLREMVQWEAEPADGGLLHIAGFDDDGIRVTDVWESVEQCQRFLEERLSPATRELGVAGEPEVAFSDLHAVWSPKAELALT
jgi:hypothetical protein